MLKRMKVICLYSRLKHLNLSHYVPQNCIDPLFFCSLCMEVTVCHSDAILCIIAADVVRILINKVIFLHIHISTVVISTLSMAVCCSSLNTKYYNILTHACPSTNPQRKVEVFMCIHQADCPILLEI